MRDERGLPGQRESTVPGKRPLKTTPVRIKYSIRSERKTRNLNVLFPDLQRQKGKIAYQGLHLGSVRVYPKNVTAKSVARFDDRNRQRATPPITSMQAVFSYPHTCALVAVAWETFHGSGRSFVSASSTCVIAASHFLTKVKAVPESDKGIDLMKNPLVTLHQSRANSQRAMAYAALRADSSLSVRRKRYNQHIQKARAAEAALSRLQTSATFPSQEHHHA